MKKFYITAAIPYVNAKPHLGHALEFVQADTIARLHRLAGDETRYLSGADENALKIFQAAEKAGKSPQDFTDENNKAFLEMIRRLDVDLDIWQRSSDVEHHFKSSQSLWKRCAAAGDIYKKTYTGLYCVGCELFYSESELNENQECFEHPGKPLDRISEENYFFRLSKYQHVLGDLISSDNLLITPPGRKNEILTFIKQGLEDFSISRSKARARGWGIPVPGDDTQIMYVWFDALNVYQTGIGFGWDEEQYKKWWPQDAMVIGKGITRFHAVYWPAILKSADLALPKQLLIHGYFTVNGQKMSKTLGNVIDPIEILTRYGTDAVRYYLLREIPTTADGDFSYTRMDQLYNADLANELGNLVSRITTLGEKDNIVIESVEKQITQTVWQSIEHFDFVSALSEIWNRIKAINVAINQVKPWELDTVSRKEHLSRWLDTIHQIGVDLAPFMPETSTQIVKAASGTIHKVAPLFPRIQKNIQQV